MKTIRLDKYLAWSAGITRTEAKNYLKKGRVTVDGVVAKKPEMKIDAESMIVVDGTACKYEEYVYIMLHKPQGVVSATEDDKEKTVLDLIENPCRGLFPVGRLDKDTEGLLLLTNDGALAHRLLSPGKHVDKCYYALLDGPVGEKEQKMFAEGLDIGDEKRTLPAKLDWDRTVGDSNEQSLPEKLDGGRTSRDTMGRILSEKQNWKEISLDMNERTQEEKLGYKDDFGRLLNRREQVVELGNENRKSSPQEGFGVYITIQEGRFHQIKRMAEAVGRRVLYLKRLSMGTLVLDEHLLPGQYRLLTKDEIVKLKGTK